ncbi:MAG: hypothetical protein WD696_17890 [Bryobacteraceae bacterium]
MLPRVLVLSLLGVGVFAEEISPRLPAMSSVYPQGSLPGVTLKVEVLGEYLDRASKVVFLDDSISGRVLEETYTRLTLEVVAAAEAAYGPHYFRVITPRGASNPLLFRIGDLPHVSEDEPNSVLERAQRVAVPATINGRLNFDGDFDFYRFKADKGESWVLDVRSARNGNGLDAGLILLDSRGRKLEHSEDVFIWDPFFVHTFAEAGEYIVVIQPTHVRLDPNFAYQLDIRRAPHLDMVSPISLRPGTTGEVTLFGAGLYRKGAKLWFSAEGFSGEVVEARGPSAVARIGIPPDAVEGPHELAIVSADGRSSTAQFVVDATPVYTGQSTVQAPASITGIARYREPERFAFDVKDGGKLVFEVRAQRFGSPVDSVLRILDAQGKEIAKNDDGAFAGVRFNKDSRLAHTFEKGGRYSIEIRNLVKTTGENYPYQLRIAPPRPSFELMLASDNPYIVAEEKGVLKVTAERRDGHDEPIRFEIKGLPPGVVAEPLEIPAGTKDVEVKLTAPGLKPGEFFQIEVEAGGETAFRSVRIASGGGEGATSARIERAAVAIVEKPLFSLESALSTVNLVRNGHAEFEVLVRRADGFDEPLEFTFENLPPGVIGERVSGAAPGREKLRLKAADDAAKGRFPRVAVLGRAAGGQIQEAPRIAVIVD